ncbi:hypothetical protein B0H13DRAFT_1918890 [Mycena leptocephala]|nr:hypothetical protein B0H13DRAFT_1918890 [Mycena leptocephala]
MDLLQLYIQPQHGVLQLQRKPPGSSGPNAYLLGAGPPPPTNNCSQMNDMLELLGHKINTNPELVKNTRVWGTALIPKILEAYRAAERGTYWTARDWRWIRDIADDLVQNRAALITSAHLGPVTDEPHWVAMVFDCRDKPVVRYGDSFKTPIPEDLLAACHWWLSQHTPTLAGLVDLPIAIQEDGHSCGMLVNNAKEHFVDPSIPLDAPAHVANSRDSYARERPGLWRHAPDERTGRSTLTERALG